MTFAQWFAQGCIAVIYVLMFVCIHLWCVITGTCCATPLHEKTAEKEQ